jgi:hypothetical protein
MKIQQAFPSAARSIASFPAFLTPDLAELKGMIDRNEMPHMITYRAAQLINAPGTSRQYAEQILDLLIRESSNDDIREFVNGMSDVNRRVDGGYSLGGMRGVIADRDRSSIPMPNKEVTDANDLIDALLGTGSQRIGFHQAEQLVDIARRGGPASLELGEDSKRDFLRFICLDGAERYSSFGEGGVFNDRIGGATLTHAALAEIEAFLRDSV